MAEIRIYPDAASLAQAAAEHFVTLATKAMASRGQFAMALAGGSTPQATYALLATEEFAARSVRSFFARHPKGKETRGGGPIPRFDLFLLGMGKDGHTASLFPGTAALHEQTRWVVAHYVDKLSAWRVTLTPVAINAAAHVTFVVSGAGKAERLRQVLIGPCRPDVLPAQIVRPTDGRLLWLVDAAAAALL